MNQIISDTNNFSIHRLEKKDLFALANFVVKENYCHHLSGNEYQNAPPLLSEEINAVYCEDICYFPYSFYYVALDKNKQIVGSIKVTRWNRKDILPIERIFNISPNEIFDNNTNIWHVGRFAISRNCYSKNITLFKKMMLYAIYPICERLNSVMVAECDQKLLRILIALGIETKILGNSVNYLGSHTIPICVERKGLLEFLNRNLSLYKKVKENNAMVDYLFN